MVSARKGEFAQLKTKEDKEAFAKNIINEISALQPSGRFLVEDTSASLPIVGTGCQGNDGSTLHPKIMNKVWALADESKALKKVKRCLSESKALKKVKRCPSEKKGGGIPSATTNSENNTKSDHAGGQQAQPPTGELVKMGPPAQRIIMLVGN